jgi:uncharacterized protein HemY
VLPAAAHVFARTGAAERARPLVEEYLEALGRGAEMQFAIINLPFVAAVTERLALAPRLLEAIERQPSSRWTDAARAYCRQEFTAAAEILEAAGARPAEAEARIRAAEQLARRGGGGEADKQLRRALAFFRSVGAVQDLSECGALAAALI